MPLNCMLTARKHLLPCLGLLILTIAVAGGPSPASKSTPGRATATKFTDDPFVGDYIGTVHPLGEYSEKSGPADGEDFKPQKCEQKESWPLLLFLHGAGERGDNLDLVKKHGPPKLIDGGKQFPFIVLSAQCPNGQWWEPFTLTALLDEIVEKYTVDQDRIFLTGLSMGGFGTWSLASRTPNRFAAIVPICGGGDPFQVKQIAHVPAWVFTTSSKTVGERSKAPVRFNLQSRKTA